MPFDTPGTNNKELTAYRSADNSNCYVLNNLVALVKQYTVIGFRQGNHVWVIHPSAKKELHWQATNYDLKKNSMLKDFLDKDIRGVLSKSTLDFTRQVMLMKAHEVDNIILNSSSRLYSAA